VSLASSTLGVTQVGEEEVVAGAAASVGDDDSDPFCSFELANNFNSMSLYRRVKTHSKKIAWAENEVWPL